MDDERIRQLTSEVMGTLRGQEAAVPAEIETRLARVEAALARIEALLAGSSPPLRPARPEAHARVRFPGHTHPSLQVLEVTAGGERCVLEPDKPCVQSHACRTLGH